jgi:hypothetical protein
MGLVKIKLHTNFKQLYALKRSVFLTVQIMRIFLRLY